MLRNTGLAYLQGNSIDIVEKLFRKRPRKIYLFTLRSTRSLKCAWKYLLLKTNSFSDNSQKKHRFLEEQIEIVYPLKKNIECVFVITG